MNESENENTAKEEMEEVLEVAQLDQARSVVKAEILRQLEGLATGAQADFEAYGEILAERAVEAARYRDDVSLQSLKRTVRMLAQKHKLRARDGAWDMFERIVQIVIQTAAGVLTGTLMIPSLEQE